MSFIKRKDSNNYIYFVTSGAVFIFNAVCARKKIIKKIDQILLTLLLDNKPAKVKKNQQ